MRTSFDRRLRRPLAHNVNLSVKAICGLGSFAKLCEMRGDKGEGDEYWKLAREFAQRWVKKPTTARSSASRSIARALDQKYNLMWDRILG